MRRSLLLGLVLPLLLAAECGDEPGSPFRVGLPVTSGPQAGLLPVEVVLPDGVDPAQALVRLDGVDVSDAFAPGGPGLVGSLPAPPPGPHRLSLTRGLGAGLARITLFASFDSPAAAPALVGSDVPAGVPRTAWLRLRFAGPVAPEALAGWGFGVECDGERLERDAVRVADPTGVAAAAVIVNPSPELPAGASCRLVWSGPGGAALELVFTVAPDAPGAPATVPYDREDAFQLPPFPDDYWLVEDAGTVSGRRLAWGVPPYTTFPLNAAANGIAAAISGRDGFSPVQPVVIQLSHDLPAAQLPADEFASLDPFAALGLYDADPASPEFGARIPFTARARTDFFPFGERFESTLTLFPAKVLRSGGSYALVATRRLAASPGRPFGPSPFFAAVAGPPAPGESARVARARASIGPVLEFLESVPEVPVPREDVALALRFSIRSHSHDPSDWVAVKEDRLAGPPIPLTVTSATPGVNGAVVFRGTIELPFYLFDLDLSTLNRDPLSGRPAPTDSEAVPFVLLLPIEAQAGPVPVVIYSHGSPGSPEEILFQHFLRDAGYAVIGIQDVGNRRFGESEDALLANTLGTVIANQALPLGEKQTHFDMFGLLRAIDWLAGESLLPLGAPDAVPEIDASRILYRGISQGAHNLGGFLPFAPEVTAAVGTVGGGRSYENIIHQADYFDLISDLQGLVPDASPSVVFAGLAALQNDADRYDPHYLQRHLYREPLAVAGQVEAPPASLLWVEGVGDNIVSNTATRSAAREFGIPQLGRVAAPTPILEQVDAPLAGNLGPGVTGGHFQFDPAATPSCGPFDEGHFCPQGGPEAEAQILHFFATALEGEAEIIDPLP